MKLKKKAKKIIIIVVVLVLLIGLGVGGFFLYKKLNPKKEIEEVKVLKSIEAYGYELKDNKDDKYKKMFKELETILRKDEVSNEEYVKKIAEMFIYDFYSLNNKTTKTDVGGVDFVLPASLENFLVNAEDTYYKYVESNLYNERKQVLPMVDVVTITTVTPTEYVYGGAKNEAYEVKVTWTYTDTKFANYQSSATLMFIKNDIKYYLVELQ